MLELGLLSTNMVGIATAFGSLTSLTSGGGGGGEFKPTVGLDTGVLLDLVVVVVVDSNNVKEDESRRSKVILASMERFIS